MLIIPMKVVYSLGEDRFQLRCMCGTEFTFVPELLNADKDTAICPKCRAKWDGDKTTEKTALTLRYFTFEVQLKGREKKAIVAIGHGVDMLHFSIPAIAGFFERIKSDSITSVIVTEINEEEFERMEQERADIIHSTLLDMIQFIVKDF